MFYNYYQELYWLQQQCQSEIQFKITNYKFYNKIQEDQWLMALSKIGLNHSQNSHHNNRVNVWWRNKYTPKLWNTFTMIGKFTFVSSKRKQNKCLIYFMIIGVAPIQKEIDCNLILPRVINYKIANF